MTITPNEKELLLAIRDSEYQDYSPEHPESGLDPVWVNCLWGFQGKTKFGGVMASLSTKGLAKTDGECAWLTVEGKAAVADVPYRCTINRAAQGVK